MVQSRQTNRCDHLFSKNEMCLNCGAYDYQSEALKTTAYCVPAHFAFKQYQKSLRKSQAKVAFPKELNLETYALLGSICQKFIFGFQTLALGINIFQNLSKMHYNQRFWASACLIVAAKGIQLDKNVPYLSRYQRYAQKLYTQAEYESAERSIFQAMNFEIQNSTFITFLNFYLTCGVVFRSDSINQSLVQFFEDDVLIRAKELLRKGTFTSYEPEKLALSIIKQTRAKYNLDEWNQQLVTITGFASKDIQAIQSDLLLRETKYTSCKYNETKNFPITKCLNTNTSPLALAKDEKPSIAIKDTKNWSISKQSIKQNVSSSISKPQAIRSRANITHSIISSYSSMLTSQGLLNRRR